MSKSSQIDYKETKYFRYGGGRAERRFAKVRNVGSLVREKVGLKPFNHLFAERLCFMELS